MNVNGSVHISDGVYNGSKNTEITIDKNINIIGQSQALTVIDGLNTAQIFNIQYPIFNIQSGINVTLQYLTITNGKGTYGGAIYNDGNLTIINSTFINNTAYNGGGGAIYNDGNLTIANSTFSNNTAYYGGDIFNHYGNLIITNGTFNNNTANDNGGAVLNYDGNLTIANTVLSNNTATAGGAIYNFQGNMAANFNRIVGNTANQGSAIYNDGILNAEKNWWGTNNNPQTIPNLIIVASGSVNTDTWVILTANANPNTINNGQTTTITADLNHINGGGDLTGGHIPDDILVTFTTAWGSFTQNLINTFNGEVRTTFRADGTSFPTINPVKVYAAADSETTTYTPVNIVVATTITADNITSFSGQNVTLRAHVNDSYNNPLNVGNITFKVNGTIMGTINVISGQATTNWTIPTNWIAGTYTITADFNGTGTNYINSTNSSTLTVDLTPTHVNVTSVHNFAGQNVTLTANVKDYYNNPVNSGKVTFTINGVDVGPVNVNTGLGTLNWTIPSNWNVGTYTITARYNETGTNYDNFTGTGNPTVDQTPITLTVSNASNFYHQFVDIAANLTDYYGNPLNGKSVTFNIFNDPNSHMATTFSNGLATLHYLIVQNAGIYAIHAVFSGDGAYLASATNPDDNLTVSKTPNSIVMDNVTSYPGQNVTFNASAFDYYSNSLNIGNITFKVNGTIIGIIDLSSGVSALNWTIPNNWIAGTYEILVEYSGTSDYQSNSTSSTLTLNHIPTNITIDPVNGYKGDNLTLTAKIENTINNITLKGKNIDFYLNGTKIGSNTTDANGTATYIYTILENIGVYDLTATFEGDEQYGLSNNTNTLTVNATPTKLTLNEVMAYKGKTIKLTITLWDSYHNNALTGQKVIFKVSGVVIGSATTNANGIATMAYKDLTGKTRTITAEYIGDNCYANSQASTQMLGVKTFTLTVKNTGTTRIHAVYYVTVYLPGKIKPTFKKYNFFLNPGKSIKINIGTYTIGTAISTDQFVYNTASTKKTVSLTNTWTAQGLKA